MSLRSLVDPRLDVEAAVALAARWNVSQVLGDGLRASMDGLGLVPPDGLALVASEPIDPVAGHASLGAFRAQPHRRAPTRRASADEPR